MKVEIPHSLGRAEAKRRIEQGLPKLAQHIPGGGSLDSEWSSPYRLELTIGTMAQKIPVTLDVSDNEIAGNVAVPVFLKMMSGQIGKFITSSAQNMLDKE